MGFGNSFIGFTYKHSVGRYLLNKQGKSELTFTIDEFKKMTRDSECNFGYGFEGALIIGNLHIDGGIHLLRFYNENETFGYVGEMEGWEYLTSPSSINKHLDELININDDIKTESPTCDTSFSPPKNCKVLKFPETKIQIIVISQFTHLIINRAATKKHIHRIIEIDKH